MNNTDPTYYLPAEWEEDTTILMAWPHEETDWCDMLPEVRKCYTKIIEAITATGRRVILIGPELSETPECLSHIPQNLLIPFRVDTNDTWTRDYGPLTLLSKHGNAVAADFRFNGWGLKFASNMDNQVNNALKKSGILRCELLNRQNFVLEGGGIESDGNGTLMTTSYCQLSPNRNPQYTRQQIQSRLCRYLGGSRVLWVDHGYLAGDDTDSHIDTLARFAPNNTIVFTGCSDPTAEHYAELNAMKKELSEMRTPAGLPYNLIELPLPDAIFDEDGNRLPATYANFLVTPDALFMPVYNQPAKDKLAEQILNVAFSQPIYKIDCTALIRQHGSLHCATMQIPNSILCL